MFLASNKKSQFKFALKTVNILHKQPSEVKACLQVLVSLSGSFNHHFQQQHREIGKYGILWYS